MRPWLTNWDLPLRGLLRKARKENCIQIETSISFFLHVSSDVIYRKLFQFCIFALLTTGLADMYHLSFIDTKRCMALTMVPSGRLDWATRGSPPPSPPPPVPTEPAACLPLQNATRCIRVLQNATLEEAYLIMLISVPASDFSLPSNGLWVCTLAGRHWMVLHREWFDLNRSLWLKKKLFSVPWLFCSHRQAGSARWWN